LLAGIPFGATEATMFVNGFTHQMTMRLIRAGLGATEREVKAGGQIVGCVRIMSTGRNFEMM
jgi:hypothetical protein